MTPEEFATALRTYCETTHASVVGTEVTYAASRLLPQTRETVAERLGLRLVHHAGHDFVRPERET